MPPRPPVLPTDLSMTYPTVIFLICPFSLNFSDRVCGGVITCFLDGFPPSNFPVFVPMPRAVTHTRFSSKRSTLKWWKCVLWSGKAPMKSNPLRASRSWPLFNGPTTGPSNVKSSLKASIGQFAAVRLKKYFALLISSSAGIGKPVHHESTIYLWATRRKFKTLSKPDNDDNERVMTAKCSK